MFHWWSCLVILFCLFPPFPLLKPLHSWLCLDLSHCAANTNRVSTSVQRAWWPVQCSRAWQDQPAMGRQMVSVVASSEFSQKKSLILDIGCILCLLYILKDEQIENVWTIKWAGWMGALLECWRTLINPTSFWKTILTLRLIENMQCLFCSSLQSIMM